MNFIQDTLINWYADNRRDLPWRHHPRPIRCGSPEVILQQTRVNQGMDYYLRFIEKWPTVTDLAQASEEEVLKQWQGLGYYSRARNLHKCARQVVEQHGGQFPADFEQLKQLKGIGDYTAAAIASIAFNLPHAVIDGNVYRVLARLYDIDTPININEGQKLFARPRRRSPQPRAARPPQPSPYGVRCSALHAQEPQLPALSPPSPMSGICPPNRNATSRETTQDQSHDKIFQLFGYQNRRQHLPPQAQR